MASKYICARITKIIEQGNRVKLSFKIQLGEYENVNEFAAASQRLILEKDLGEYTVIIDSFPVSKSKINSRIESVLKLLNTKNYEVAGT